jgi:hypothetical protein
MSMVTDAEIKQEKFFREIEGLLEIKLTQWQKQEIGRHIPMNNSAVIPAFTSVVSGSDLNTFDFPNGTLLVVNNG